MDDPRYRRQPKPAALNQRRRHPLHLPAPLWRGLAAVALAAVCFSVWRAADPEAETPPRVGDGVSSLPPAMAEKLAGTWTEAARIRLEQGRPAETLALLAVALRTDPRAEESRALAVDVLAETVWHFPDLRMRHPLPVERLAVSGNEALWVGMGGKNSTVARWDLAALSMDAVMFPVADSVPRSMVVGPHGRRLVIERAGVLLLCDAVTLKPVADLGDLPDEVTPESVIVFSPDGLLFAHPADEDGRLVWLLRDAQSGQVLRRHGPEADTTSVVARPLTAILDRRHLRVLHADGGVLSIPVSPVDPPEFETPREPMRLAHAQYSADGRSLLAWIDAGPLAPPELKCLPAETAQGVGDSALELFRRFPWSRQPGIWCGLLRESDHSPLRVTGRMLDFRDEPVAPIHVAAPVHAVARARDAVIVGCGDGSLIRFRLLPLPDSKETEESVLAGEAAVDAFAQLAAALCGVIYDEDRKSYGALADDDRLAAARACDPAALAGMFPGLDFSGVLDSLRALSPRVAGDDSMLPLTDRLERANPQAAALAAALESSEPGEIAKYLAEADDLPPLLRTLAESRIAWIEGRKMAAIARWPEPFPDYRRLRLTEDWDGWERPDFGPLFEDFREDVKSELATLRLPENATQAQRDALFERLTDPETAQALGRPRLAAFCLEAAGGFSAFADEAARTLVLATIAHNFGADPAASLRAIAHAHLAAGDYESAHKRWIELLSGQPVESHLPDDYTEAAYTAFETAHSDQAMEILLAGVRRFPENSDLALRAGWIALLTDQAETAYRFLLAGQHAGFAEDQMEHATVLLAIAAARSGEIFEADTYFEQLTSMNPDWSDPATIEELDWPEELKSTLRQFTW
jgi:tetratricopeptide (TPR) repeat protein